MRRNSLRAVNIEQEDPQTLPRDRQISISAGAQSKGPLNTKRKPLHTLDLKIIRQKEQQSLSVVQTRELL